MSIGGNDAGFADIVKSCMIPIYQCNGDPAVTNPLAAAFASLPTRLDEVSAAVPSNVRNVFVTAYPDPTTGPDGQRCGTTFDPAFFGMDGIDTTEAIWASGTLVAGLNNNLAGMVARANARPGPHPVFTFVKDGILSRFNTHGYCSGAGSQNPFNWGTPRFISTPADSIASQGDVFGTMHPNDLGQQAIGSALFDVMRSLAGPLSISVNGPGIVIGNPTPLTFDVRTSVGIPVAGAPVFVDGVQRGTTDQNGRVAATLTFTAIGWHTVSVDVDPYPAASANFIVLGRTYSVTASPTPIPINVNIPALTLTARDTAGNVLPGTFRISGNGNNLSVGSGGTINNAKVTVTYTYVWDTDGNDRPIRIKVPVCPDLTFTPADGAVFSSGTYTHLISGC
jgi:hypothetical protein